MGCNMSKMNYAARNLISTKASHQPQPLSTPSVHLPMPTLSLQSPQTMLLISLHTHLRTFGEGSAGITALALREHPYYRHIRKILLM